MDNSPKVLLLNPPTDNSYNISIQPPLGILYIGAYLRRDGVKVKILDLNVSKGWKKELLDVLSTFKPTDVGISSNVSNRFNTFRVADVIKEISRDIDIIVGGPHPTIEPEIYQQPPIDYILPYEAEQAMSDFIKTGKARGRRGKRRGVTRLLDNKKTEPPVLDTLPFPAYDLIPIDKYYINSFRKRPLVSMVTSRGCPGRCVFCNQEVFGHTWRARSAGNVVAEMEWIERVIGAREVSIEDDNFTVDAQRVYDICALKRSRGNQLSWQLANGVRVDHLTKELLREMKAAGCWKIAIAPEVGDQESFVSIKKGGSLDKFRQVAKWCKELGLVYYGFFLIGFPFQTPEQIKQTIDFALELDPLIMDLSKVVPFKGTALYQQYPELAERMKTDVATYYDRQNNECLEQMYRKAHYRFYLRPAKIAEIIRKIGFKSFARFVAYGIQVFYFKP